MQEILPVIVAAQAEVGEVMKKLAKYGITICGVLLCVEDVLMPKLIK